MITERSTSMLANFFRFCLPYPKEFAIRLVARHQQNEKALAAIPPTFSFCLLPFDFCLLICQGVAHGPLCRQQPLGQAL